MRHEMLAQCALFCMDSNTKKGTLSQQFVTHFAPPLRSYGMSPVIRTHILDYPNWILNGVPLPLR